jgi:1,2-diacylglycerol 3-alpha-glucosyltransferase
VKIGVATDFYYPWIGGPATFIRNLGHGLSARGHSIALLCPSADGEPGNEYDGPMHVRRARSVSVPFGYQLRVSSSPLVDVSRWLDAVQPDVVHVHHPFPLSVAATWMAKHRGIPVIATNHTIPECSLWGLRTARVIYPLVTGAFGRWIVQQLRQCEAVTTPTETAAELLRSIGFAGPLTAISNGVNTSRFRPGPRPVDLARRLGIDERPVVLYTGRLDAEKQMDVWLRAAAVLARALDVQFLVGGKGSERTRLEALAKELGLDRRLHFFGYLSDEEYPLIYRLADAFCITSEVELQSIATLEAIASGVPAVGVSAAALPELIVNGLNGFLADPGDSIGIARHLHQLLSSPDLGSEMGRRSRTIAERHDLSHTIASYEVILTEACLAKTAVPA